LRCSYDLRRSHCSETRTSTHGAMTRGGFRCGWRGRWDPGFGIEELGKTGLLSRLARPGLPVPKRPHSRFMPKPPRHSRDELSGRVSANKKSHTDSQEEELSGPGPRFTQGLFLVLGRPGRRRPVWAVGAKHHIEAKGKPMPPSLAGGRLYATTIRCHSRPEWGPPHFSTPISRSRSGGHPPSPPRLI